MAGPTSSRASLIANLVLSLTVTALFLGAAELVARRLERPRLPLDPSDRTMDWEKEWGDDFYVIRSVSAGWPPTDQFTRDGVRDHPHAPEKPEGVHRVVCLGDSVTFGYGVGRNQAYPSVLQSRLDARGPGVEVINVSLMAWSTRQERIAYERIARRYHPDLILLGVCLNDPQELANNLSRPPALLSRLHERSALVRWIVNARGREIRNVQELFTQPEAPKVRASMEQFFGELRQLHAELKADGVPLSVLVFPYAGQVGSDPPPPVVQEKIRAFCAREALPFLDLLPGLRPLGVSAFISGDHLHLSAEGCARVADRVLDAGLVPRDWASVADLTKALDADAQELKPARAKDLVFLLAHPAAAVRAEAAWSLGSLGPSARTAVPALLRGLGDPQERVRYNAAVALGRIRSTEARAALFGALRDTRQGVRWRAADALHAIGLHSEDAASLVAAVGNNDAYVRAFAAWTLGELGSESRGVAASLGGIALDADPGVRAAAVTALGHIGSAEPKAVAALGHGMRDSGWEERWRAARALGLIGPGAAPAVPDLLAGLADPSDRVRREAARALGRIGPGAEAALSALDAARRDPSEAVREAAARAASRIVTIRRGR
jgi:HEAT repeat protein/lysophospholipase L1-like esterase